MRYAYHVALEETASAYVHDITDQRKERAWKLLVLLWRMLLHRPSATGRLGKEEFARRLDQFEGGR